MSKYHSRGQRFASVFDVALSHAVRSCLKERKTGGNFLISKGKLIPKAKHFFSYSQGTHKRMGKQSLYLNSF